MLIGRSRDLERSRSLIDELGEITSAYGVSRAQVALNWLINFYGDTVVAIPGASKAKHAEESADAQLFQLSRKELDRLDELSRRPRSQRCGCSANCWTRPGRPTLRSTMSRDGTACARDLNGGSISAIVNTEVFFVGARTFLITERASSHPGAVRLGSIPVEPAAWYPREWPISRVSSP